MLRIAIFLFIPFLLFTQEIGANKITVDASSTVYVVADILYFSIDLSIENPDPQKAFDQHELLEKKLLDLFAEFSIPDSSVQYSLLSIRKIDPRNDEKRFMTSQKVKVTFNDLSKYHEFQVKLLSNGFYVFRSGFGSSEIEKARKSGYKAALKNAKRDARIIAETLGKKIGEIIEISTRTNEFRQLDHSSELRVASVHSLIEIEQTLGARTNLKVTFKLN